MNAAPPSPAGASRPIRVLLVALLALLAVPAFAGAATVTELTDPTPGAVPSGLTTDADGNAWFTDPGAGRIVRVSPGNVLQGFSANVASTATGGPPPPLTPRRIAVGPDGALWYTIDEGGIARMTTEGVVTRYAVSPAGPTAGITAGPDGAMWFTVPDQNVIGRITAPTDAQVADGAPRGQSTTFTAGAAGSAPEDVVLGGDGALWFTEPGANSIGRAVPGVRAPTITHLPLPTPGGAPSRLTVGPDGNVWFSAPGTNRIGRVVGGAVVELPLPAGSGPPGDVAPGADGALWFVDGVGTSAALGRITAAGDVTRLLLPGPGGALNELVPGPDGQLRYTRAGARIGRVDTLAPAAEQPPPPPLPPALVPAAGRTVVLEVVSGTIRVRRPGRSLFEPLLAGGAELPDGTEVDAREGRVRLTAETAPGTGITRSAIFWDGRFVIRQTRAAGAATEVRLTGRPACGAPPAETRAAKRRRSRVGRRLWGDGKGTFRTRGARATASVRGTRWLVEDRCDQTTRVRVFTGTVSVRDRVRNRRVTITDGEQYVAPGPRRRR